VGDCPLSASKSCLSEGALPNYGGISRPSGGIPRAGGLSRSRVCGGAAAQSCETALIPCASELQPDSGVEPASFRPLLGSPRFDLIPRQAELRSEGPEHLQYVGQFLALLGRG
jgi:hypothetical protein